MIQGNNGQQTNEVTIQGSKLRKQKLMYTGEIVVQCMMKAIPKYIIGY